MIGDETTLDESDDVNVYREAGLIYIRLVNTIGAFLAETTSPRVGIWAVNYALGLTVCEGMSITDRAEQLGVSPQALSKQIKKFQSESGVDPSTYMYRKS